MTGHLLRVYIGLLLASIGSVVVTLMVMFTPTDDDVRVIEESLRGGLLLAVETLDAAPDEEAARAALEAKFGIPIAILDPLPLPRPVTYTMDPDGLGYALGALEDGRRVQIGPYRDFGLDGQRVIGGLIALAVVWGLVAVVLVRPQLAALRGLEAAAERLAGGDWGTRVGDAVPDHARSLARAFDRMAAEIEDHIAARRRMMQVVSHELRTPLTRLQFGVDLLADAADDAERQQHADGLFADIEALDGLVDELKAFVRLDRPAPMEPALLDVAAALDRLVASTTGEVAVERASLPSDAPLYADPRLFDRAVGNLIRNAVRHARQRVVLTAERLDAGWRIIVDDDGPGIPPADRARALEPFVRLDPEAGPGSGLGLSIVQRIARDHGGALSIEASPAGGARVAVIWPDVH